LHINSIRHGQHFQLRTHSKKRILLGGGNSINSGRWILKQNLQKSHWNYIIQAIDMKPGS